MQRALVPGSFIKLVELLNQVHLRHPCTVIDRQHGDALGESS